MRPSRMAVPRCGGVRRSHGRSPPCRDSLSREHRRSRAPAHRSGNAPVNNRYIRPPAKAAGATFRPEGGNGVPDPRTAGGERRRDGDPRLDPRSSARCSPCSSSTRTASSPSSASPRSLWDIAPDTAPKAIQTHVSRLRKVLPEGVLRTRPPGYVLELVPGPARSPPVRGAPRRGPRRACRQRSGARRRAFSPKRLSLWRGQALAEFASEPLWRSGRHSPRGAASGDAGGADRSKPRAREGKPSSSASSRDSWPGTRSASACAGSSCWRYTGGPQAEALSVYQDGRRTLVEELGLEPSRALQELERAILRHDASLDAVSRAATRCGRRSSRAASRRCAGVRRRVGAPSSVASASSEC